MSGCARDGYRKRWADRASSEPACASRLSYETIGPVEQTLEVVGPLPREWVEDLLVYYAAMIERPWGGSGIERIVFGDMDQSLQAWWTREEYERWHSYQAQRSVAPAGKTIVANDGKQTAIVIPFADPLPFLTLAGHELVEAALAERQANEGYQFVERTQAEAAHVLWTEYVVERTRRSIFNDLGWGASVFEDESPAVQLQQFEAELPSLAKQAAETWDEPPEWFLHFYEVARVYAMSRGRADAGSPADEARFPIFSQCALGADLANQWRDFDASLAAAFAQPTASTTALDDLVHDEGWRPLHDEYRAIWEYLVQTEQDAAG